MKPTKTAQHWIMQGIKEHKAFVQTFRSARAHMMNAGFFFLSARSCVGDGAWGELLLGFDHLIKPRTIQQYMQIAEAAIGWVKEMQPSLKGLPKIQAAAREVVMQSPKPMIALLRDLRELRPFGEYDAVKYAAQKRLGPVQFEFAFDKLVTAFDALSHVSEPNFVLNLPDGKTEEEALQELLQKAEIAAEKVREELAHRKGPLLDA